MTYPFDQPGGMSQIAVPQDQSQAQNTGYSIQQMQGMQQNSQGINQAQQQMQGISNQIGQIIQYNSKKMQEDKRLNDFLQQCEELTKETKE